MARSQNSKILQSFTTFRSATLSKQRLPFPLLLSPQLDVPVLLLPVIESMGGLIGASSQACRVGGKPTALELTDVVISSVPGAKITLALVAGAYVAICVRCASRLTCSQAFHGHNHFCGAG